MVNLVYVISLLVGQRILRTPLGIDFFSINDQYMIFMRCRA